MAGIPREVLEHFRSVPLFSTLSDADLRAVVMAADELDEPAGAVLVREGEVRRELFVITRGTATATRNGHELRTMGPGDFFGEIALLSGGERTATVTASTDVSLMMLAPTPFRRVLSTEPKALEAIMHALGERLRGHEATAV
jgi:voltage-gated potassium channel